MELETHVQILDEGVCTSICANALGIGTNQSVLHMSAPGNISLGSSALESNQPRKWKILNSNELYFVKKLTLCHILPVVEGLHTYKFQW